MSALRAMVVKDLRLLVRDRMGAFFTLVFPLVMAVFFGTVFSAGSSGPRGIRVAVVDEDSTDASRRLVDSLSAGPELRVTSMGRGEAVEAVTLGRQSAYIVIPRGFGEASEQVFYGDPPTLELGSDPARAAESGLLQGILTKHMARRFQTVLSDTARTGELLRRSRAELRDPASRLSPQERGTLDRFLGELDRFLASPVSRERPGGETRGLEPVRIESHDVARQSMGPRNAYQVSFPQGILWGVLSCAFGFALGLVLERQRGTLIRLRVAPLPRTTILAGKAVGCFLAIVTIATVLLVLGATVFDVRPHSVPLLAGAVISIALGFVGIMMFVSVMGKTPAAVSGLGWGLMMFMAMLGGGMIPLAFMPEWLQRISHASPVKWGILALEGAIWRGFTPAQMALPCGILVAVGVVTFALGVRAYRWTEA